MTSYRIGDLCSFAKGASVPRSRMLDEGDYLYLHYGDLYKGHDLYIDIEHPQKAIPFISRNEKLQMGQFANDGDIIYVLTSETVEDLGKAMLLANPNHHPVVAGTETTIMRIKRPDIVSSAWLNYFIQTKRFKKLLHQYVTGMKVFRVHPRDISRIKIDIPDKGTQKRVVAILDAMHNKIQTNRKINDYLYELCQSKLTSLLKKSTPELTNVENYCDRLYSGGTPSTSEPEYWNGQLPWLSSGETGHRFIINAEKHITEKGVRESSTKLAHKGDVVMASAGQGFTRGQTSMLFFDTYVNQSVLVLKPKPNCGAFLLLQLGNSYNALRAWSDSTSTRGSISGKLLKQFGLPLIANNQLEELNCFCQPIFDKIESNLNECLNLSELRDALLPKLISGEIDVSRLDLVQLNNHLSDC